MLRNPHALLSLSLAGLPLTSGALAKLVTKPLFGDGLAGMLATLTAVTSAVPMLHFLRLLARMAPEGAERPRPGDIGTVEISYAAPHHLVADGGITGLRRTRGGDAPQLYFLPLAPQAQIGALRASGDIHYPVLASVASLVLVLGLGSYWMGRWFGLPGIWLAYVVDECLRGWLMWWRWHRRGWLLHARGTVRLLRHG